MDRKHVSSGSRFEPIIGFSRVVKAGPLVAISGTAPIGQDGKTASVGDVAGQTRRCVEIIRDALAELNLDLSHVVRTRLFLTRIADWEAAGRAHGEFFGEIRPASTLVEVSGLINPEWLVEMEADAWAGE